MFKVTPAQDEAERAATAAALGIPLFGAFTYRMTDEESGALLGASQFDIFSGYGEIYSLAEAAGHDDREAMFILGRATMNFIDLCGAHECRAADTTASPALLRALGFRARAGGAFAVDMTDMFSGHCGGHTVTLPKEEK